MGESRNINQQDTALKAGSGRHVFFRKIVSFKIPQIALFFRGSYSNCKLDKSINSSVLKK